MPIFPIFLIPCMKAFRETLMLVSTSIKTIGDGPKKGPPGPENCRGTEAVVTVGVEISIRADMLGAEDVEVVEVVLCVLVVLPPLLVILVLDDPLAGEFNTFKVRGILGDERSTLNSLSKCITWDKW